VLTYLDAIHCPKNIRIIDNIIIDLDFCSMDCVIGHTATSNLILISQLGIAMCAYVIGRCSGADDGEGDA